MNPETFRFCRYEIDAQVVTITIDRPEVLNSVHPEGHLELSHAFDCFAADPNLRVAILTGSGERSFCVGTDLKWLAATGLANKPKTGFGGITHRFDLWKPVIAAVNGLCLGGGMEMVTACDLAIAADHAKFGLPESRVGLAASGGGMLQRLPRQIAMKHAMALVLTGSSISAGEARSMGVINEVVPYAQLMTRARALADEILACAPLSVTGSKQMMLQSLAHADLESSMHENYPIVQQMLASNDAIEGPKAFAEKRKPVWTGT